jgi:DNA polymerase-4
MDAFYVAVEVRRDATLAGKAVVVGGTGARGVVAAASYEARRFGVHSAMATAQARRLCPHALFLAGDYARYARASEEVFAVLTSFTPVVEPISLDEAFLDVSGARRLFGDGREIAERIRAAIAEELGLPCSVGVAPVKFLAKLASEAAKPSASAAGIRPGRGVVVIEPGEELAFLHPLPVQALWGVGPATLARLRRLGVGTVGDLAAIPEPTLVRTLGAAHGQHLRRLAHAIDERMVEPVRDTKSIGHEQTFARDLDDRDELAREVVRMSDAVASRLRAAGLDARTVTLKVRFASFATITRSHTLTNATDTGADLTAAGLELLAKVDPSPGIRLLGVSVSNLSAARGHQLSFDDAAEPAWAGATRAVDEIRVRFGVEAIGPATLVEREGLRLTRRGLQEWGPDGDGEGRG